MAGPTKENLELNPGVEATTEESSEARAVYLRDGRTLTVSDVGSDQLVEIRSGAGLLELRIQLTEQGPVLQMESVRLQLKASEAVEIESARVQITGAEQVTMHGGSVAVTSDEAVKVDAAGEVRVTGTTIHLN
jgi:hypothetical protein